MFGEISQDQLVNLEKYKYSCIDKSLLSIYVLQPYWNWAVTLFPLWMAPNLITMIGFSFMLGNYGILWLVNPTLKDPVSSLMCVSFSIGLWLYSTFDNVDGRQARRTKSSSPLGQLFDHGCDALNCGVGTILQTAAMNLGPSYLTAAAVALVASAFYITAWEEYHTGTMYLGYLNGPTEGIVLGCLMMLACAVFGHEIFHQVMFGYPLTHLIFGVFFLSLMFIQLPFNVYAVSQTCKNGKRLSDCLKQLNSFVVFLFLSGSWLYTSNVLKEDFFLFFTILTVVFGRMATKIHLAHLLKQPFPQSTALLVPLGIGNLLPFTVSESSEHLFVLFYLGLALATYGYWATQIVNSFCKYLKVRLFRI